MFASKDKLRYQESRNEDWARTCAYELVINTSMSKSNVREMFAEQFPDYGYVLDEVFEEVEEMANAVGS